MSHHNKNLVPVCIIYIDGVRLSQKLEGALRSVRVFDCMNRIGVSILGFDADEVDNKFIKEELLFETPISIHMGYKDDLKEVFKGELTGMSIEFDEYEKIFSIYISSYLQRLNHDEHDRTFYHMTPAQAIKKTVENRGLKCFIDNFGKKRESWKGGQQTDYSFISEQAKIHGMDIHCEGDKVYVKRLMTHNKEEIIYEWGKSLISFEIKENLDGQVGAVEIIGRNPMMRKSFKGKVKIGDLGQKMGGRKDWTQVVKTGKARLERERTDHIFSHAPDDEKEAKELAEGILREKSFKLMRAEGKAEGNPRLKAGGTVTVKYVGKAHSGEYIAEAVVHRFTLDEGYTTEFYLKRNMYDEEYMKVASGAVMGFSGHRTMATATKTTQEEDDNDETVTEEKPKFYNLEWRKDGQAVTEALIDDEVTMNFCVENIPEGETVKVTIWEHDEDEDHDEIKETEGKVKDGKVEIPWKVEYHEDDDDSPSSCAREIEKYGYTVPEYFFVAEYGGVSSDEHGNIAKLETKDWIGRQVNDKTTGELFTNRKYTIILPNGSKIEGESDGDGFINTTFDIMNGDCLFYFHKADK